MALRTVRLTGRGGDDRIAFIPPERAMRTSTDRIGRGRSDGSDGVVHASQPPIQPEVEGVYVGIGGIHFRGPGGEGGKPVQQRFEYNAG